METAYTKSKIDKNKLKEFLYKIIEKQHAQQTITVSSANMVEDYPTEFIFLKSKGIVIEEKDKSLRFFHQSFYDYLFC